MVLEVADIRIISGKNSEFEAAVKFGLDTVLSHSSGFISYEIRRSNETQDRYLLLIEWKNLEDHTVVFRESDAYKRWSEIVRPFFAESPKVEHFELIDQKRA